MRRSSPPPSTTKTPARPASPSRPPPPAAGRRLAVALGPEAQRAQRHAQRVLPASGGDRHGRGHAGLEREVAVVDADDHVVGHHVQHRDRRVAHLHHASLEDAARDRRRRRSSRVWPSRRPPMSDSLTLAFSCILVRSWAITNRVGVWKLAATVWPTSTLREITTPSTGERIVRVAEGDAGLLEPGRGLLHAGFRERQLGDGLVAVALRGVELVLRDQIAGAQALVPLEGELLELEVRARLLDAGPRVREVRFFLAHLHLVGRRIDLGDGLAGDDGRVEVDVDRQDRARDVGADLDLRHGLDGARRGHRRDDRAAVDGLGQVAALRRVVAPAGGHTDSGCEQRAELPESRRIHDCGSSWPIARSSSATAVWNP